MKTARTNLREWGPARQLTLGGVALGAIALLYGALGESATHGATPVLAYADSPADAHVARKLPEEAWRPRTGPRLSFGSGWSGYVRFQWKSPPDVARQYISIGPPSVDRFELYVPDGLTLQRHVGGDQESIDRRALLSQTWSYPLEARGGETLIGYVRFFNERRNLAEILVRTQQELQATVRVESIRLGVLFGVVLLLLLSAGLLVTLGRATMYWAYLAYLFCASFVLLDAEGVLYPLLGPLPGLLGSGRVNVAAALACGFVLTFTLSFLVLAEPPPWARAFVLAARFGRMLALAYLLLLLLPVGVPPGIAMNVVVIYSVLAATGLGLVSWKLGLPQAGLFVLGWFVLALFVSFHQLGAMGLHELAFRPTLVQVGVIGEALIFSFALTLRNRALMRERVSAEARLEQVQQELELACTVHGRLLPARLPDEPGLAMHLHYAPQSQMGGDLYAFHHHNGDLIALLADVTGHGITAALDSSVVWAGFREATVKESEPAGIIRSMNQFLVGHLGFRFVTACCVRVNMARSKMFVCSGGHVPVLHVRGNSATFVGPIGTLLGYDPAAEYTEDEVVVQAGDRILLYTDGLVESHTRTPELTGIEALAKLAAEAPSLSAAPFAQFIVDGMREYRADPTQADDVTLLVLEVTGGRWQEVAQGLMVSESAGPAPHLPELGTMQ